MRRIASALMAGALMLWGVAAVAAERLVVVELFTSQGCASCPPADALLGELAKRDDVLPLALHVDYWDYIGWTDNFASPEHTKRQRAYARASGSQTIYTPQIVVGGHDHIIGNRPMELFQTISRHSGQAAGARLDLQRSGNRLRIAIEPGRAEPGAYRVLLVRFLPSQTVAIRRGENAGRTLTYHNIVTALDQVGRWSGRNRFSETVPITGPGEVAVLVQKDGHGPIIAAARAGG